MKALSPVSALTVLIATSLSVLRGAMSNLWA